MNDSERAKFLQERINFMKKKSGRAFVNVVGKVEGLNVRENEIHGLDIFDGSKGEVKGLKIIGNKAYGGKNPITLGNAFGVEIAGNFADVELPRELIDQAKAAKTEEQRQSVKEKLKNLIPDANLLPPLLEIFAKWMGG